MTLLNCVASAFPAASLSEQSGDLSAWRIPLIGAAGNALAITVQKNINQKFFNAAQS
jgi:hypothetical protein